MEQGDARPTMGLQDVLELLTGAPPQDAAREQDLCAAPDVKDDVRGRRKC